jgi:hypothetical protein
MEELVSAINSPNTCSLRLFRVTFAWRYNTAEADPSCLLLGRSLLATSPSQYVLVEVPALHASARTSEIVWGFSPSFLQTISTLPFHRGALGRLLDGKAWVARHSSVVRVSSSSQH